MYQKISVNGKPFFEYKYVSDELGVYKRLIASSEEELTLKIQKEKENREQVLSLFSGEERLSDVIDYWIKNIASGGIGKTTSLGALKGIFLNINQIIIRERTHFGQLPLKDLTQTNIEQLLEELSHDFYQKKLEEVQDLFLRFTIFSNRLGFTDITKINLPATSRTHFGNENLTFEEMQRIITSTTKGEFGKKDTYGYYAIALLCMTGITLNEAILLKWNDIDFEHHILTLQERTLKVSHRVISILSTILEKQKENSQFDTYVFPNANKDASTGYVSKSSLEAQIKTVANYLCIPRLTAQIIRYNYGRWALKQGYFMQDIMASMGYTSQNHFTQYFQSVIKDELSEEERESFFNNSTLKSNEVVDIFRSHINLSAMTEKEKDQLILELLEQLE